ncbi:lysoplasmalogenase family protein [Psychroserpens sp.]|uniref:lysoplasmalogenase family protein n=1 Tax=Psychroserpens sp. TaxID=2020870 RepID=UPI0039E4552B
MIGLKDLFKPALVCSLLVFFMLKGTALHKKLGFIIVCALVFFLTGDSLLIDVIASPNLFLLVLLAFVLAHIMFVIVFLKHKNNT